MSRAATGSGAAHKPSATNWVVPEKTSAHINPVSLSDNPLCAARAPKTSP
jgi:hypothetical protein